MGKVLAIAAVVSYLLGSIPFGYILVRVFRGEDVRSTGSGNIGATNVARTGSKGLAIATLALDALKGYAAVRFSIWLAGRYPLQTSAAGTIYDQTEHGISANGILLVAAVAAFCAVLGHVFTIWLHFKGGKGVATAVGAFGALAPLATVLVLGVFAVLVALTRHVSLGSIAGAAAFPFFVWWLYPAARSNGPILLLICMASLLIIIRHRDNIRRLLAGTENRF